MNISNKIITAVEWFYQRMFAKDITSVFNQAKEMEKQQIIDSYVVANGELIEHSIPRAEHYYNETFNK